MTALKNTKGCVKADGGLFGGREGTSKESRGKRETARELNPKLQ